MKILFMALLLVSNLLAYQKGDVIEQNMASHLGLKENKIYVIDFFASWCGSCKKELPLISKANLRIDTSKVEIIGVDVDKDVNAGVKFQKDLKAQNGLNFRVINDPQNLVIAKFNPIGMPTLYYVQNRKVLKIITGAVDNIDKRILEDLKGME